MARPSRVGLLDLNGEDPVVFHAMRLRPKSYPLEDAARRFERLSKQRSVSKAIRQALRARARCQRGEHGS